jgi:crotonobetainyl-CoA:carnitine CoA-transferase CaiB-like acyl-CoA transferase
VPLCDVVVDNFRPGVMGRFGLDATTLLEQFPALVVASSSAHGGTGPDATRAGLASIFSASGGLGEQTGYADGPPTDVGESTDYRSGNLLAVGILAALVHRHNTGRGQSVDVSSVEAVAALAPDALLAHAVGAAPPGRMGNRHPLCAPHNVYASADGEWLSIAITTDAEWGTLAALIGKPEWKQAYPTARDRKRSEDAIDAAVASWVSTRPVHDAFLALQQHGVPAAPSFTANQLAEDPHLAARGVFVDVDHPVIGTQRVMRAPWIMSETPCTIERHGPILGQDNDYVLEELLGLTTDAVEARSDAFR